MTERQKTHELLDYGLQLIERNFARVESLVMSRRTYDRLLELDLAYDCFEYRFNDGMEYGVVEFVPEKIVHPKWMYDVKLVEPVKRQMVNVLGGGVRVLEDMRIVDAETGDVKRILGRQILAFGVEKSK